MSMLRYVIQLGAVPFKNVTYYVFRICNRLPYIQILNRRNINNSSIQLAIFIANYIFYYEKVVFFHVVFLKTQYGRVRLLVVYQPRFSCCQPKNSFGRYLKKYKINESPIPLCSWLHIAFKPILVLLLIHSNNIFPLSIFHTTSITYIPTYLVIRKKNIIFNDLSVCRVGHLLDF